ncbi:hypothetical protein [Fulvivirga lutea]|uniref:Multidrug transporter n=1 Tax=Fulvivirga lutea TaxID=2810512 RepID=A0A974WJF2_9BACT|nr:hypothetical protein [Fulvivirga lutea]QSE98317.1 hypothetical protein JR347_04355 [Fulvivirga lutea]
MKKILSLLAAFGVMFYLASCSDDDDPAADNGVTISGIPATASIENLGTLGPVTATVQGNDGLVSLVVTKDDTALETVDLTGNTTATYEFSYTATEEDASKNIVFTFTATDVDGDTDVVTHVLSVGATPVVIVRGDIEENTTWTADNIYQLDTRVTVLAGVTLTIEPGTVIKGNEGQGAAATALLVARDGVLNAQGTAELPIIFTSILDPIDPADVAAGNYASTTSETQSGLWGGVIVLGNAPITAKTDEASDLSEIQIEGIPSSDPNGLYGGDDENDNSGTISYISIRHGGTNIGSGNEINGLTLGGVGAGTTISNVEVVANADDGIEFFGGSVSVDGAVIWNSFDDSMDTDMDYNGVVENFIIVTPNTGSAFELDGPEGSITRGEDHIFTEGVIYGGPDIDAIVDWDDDTNASLNNLYFFGIEAGRIESFGGVGTNANSNTANWETDLADNSGGFFDGAESVLTFGVDVSSKSYGPTAADFAWSWAGNSGALEALGL